MQQMDLRNQQSFGKRGKTMPRKGPSKSRVKYLIKDEKKASAEYAKYGFKGLSKDESRHKRFLERKLKGMK